MQFPNDANGDALRRMQAEGDDLTLPRNIEFTVVFPAEHKAKRFAHHFRELGFAVSVECTGALQDSPWDVIVVKHMVPSHEEIAAFEASLQQVAEAMGGRNDGWGCFSERASN